MSDDTRTADTRTDETRTDKTRTDQTRPDDVGVNDPFELVEEWLPLPDAAERLGLDVGRVRRLLQDRLLVAVRRGERSILSIPAVLIKDGQVMPELAGTMTLLLDSGYDEEAALRWLLTPDDTLPGTPVDALRAGRKTEVRRRAQALAF